MTLEKLRKKIDWLDRQISALLDKRADLVKKVGKEKKKVGVKIANPEREMLVLSNVSTGMGNKKFIKKCFESIIKESRKLQK